MAEVEPGASGPSALVLVLFLTVGGEFIRIAVATAMSGDRTGAIFPAAIGVGLVAIGAFRNRFGSPLAKAASNIWVWAGVLFIIFAYEAIPLAIIRVETAAKLPPPPQIENSYSAHRFGVRGAFDLVNMIVRNDGIDETKEWPLLITATDANRKMPEDLWTIIRQTGMKWPNLSAPDNAHDLDAPKLPETGPGIIIHGDNALAQKMYNALRVCFIVSRTVKFIPDLEAYYAKNMKPPPAGPVTWIEIGTGSPWNDRAIGAPLITCYEKE
jgi:hypothetical protein